MVNYSLLVPEIFLLTMICVILVIDVYLKDKDSKVAYCLTQLTLLVAAYFSFQLMGAREVTLSGAFVSDNLAHLLKISIYLVSFCVFMYSREYVTARKILIGEYYCLGLSAVLGMMVMVSSGNMLSIYLGIELLSLSLYAMIAMQRDVRRVSEAAIKYFVMGAIASGMLLYGISMVYGITQTIQIAEISQSISAFSSPNLVLNFGLVFIMVGIGFKLGVVPFHMWVPDVYHGAPTSVTAFLSSAPKIAAFGMVIRVLVEALGELQTDWQQMLMMLSVLSIGVGNVIAISQSNIKRMLAYSAIAHMGYFLLGMLSGTTEGYVSSLFYILTYALMSMGAFGIITLLSRNGFEAENIEDFKGLGRLHPWYAFIMLLLMFSMAGVPPTVGFYAKLSVLKAVVSAELMWLAIAAVFFSIIGVFYYLRIVKTMYFDEPAEGHHIEKSSTASELLISVNGLAVIGLGLFPSLLMTLCAAVFGL